MNSKAFLVAFLLTGYAAFAQQLDNVYDVSADRADLEKQCRLEHQNASSSGVTSREAHLSIDKKYQDAARALESKRGGAVKELFNKADVEMPKQMGTDPSAGRGIFGDIDTANMSTEDIAKLNKVIEAHNNTPGVTKKYTMVDKGGYVQVKELDITTFKKFPDPDKFVFTRGAGKETALAYRTDSSGGTSNAQVRRISKDGKVTVIKESAAVVDKHIYNLDNMKKVGGDFGKANIGDVDFQNVGKGTMRIIENTYGLNLEKIKDPVKKAQMQELLNKCRDMKSYSPETAGLHSDEQKKAFLDEAKGTISDAYKAEAGATEKALADQRDASWTKMQELKEKLKASRGQNAELKAELEATKKFYDAESKALHKYRQTQLAAENGIVKNGGTELLADAKGQKVQKTTLPDGGNGYMEIESKKTLSKSQMQEQLIAPAKKKAFEAPLSPKSVESATTINDRKSLGRNGAFCEGVNMADNAVEMYQIYQTVGAYLPGDMDPATKKGVQLIIAAASANQVAKAATQATIGGGQAGFDELVKWYKEHPGQEPDQWETFKIGLRGSNNFLKDTAKGMAYGFTVKPFQDIYDIGYRLGDTIVQQRNAEAAQAVAEAKDAEVKETVGNKLIAITEAVNKCEEIINNIAQQKDTTKDERGQCSQLKSDIESIRKQMRKVEVITSIREQIDIDKRLNEYNTLEAQVQKLVAATNSLSKSYQNCFLTVRVTNSEDNSPCAVSWINASGPEYSTVLRDAPGSVFNFRAVLPGSYRLDIYAQGRAPKKDFIVVLDRSKERYYSVVVPLDVAAEESPNYAQFTISAFDAATKKAITNVKFHLVNNQRPVVDFNSPTGSMGMNLEIGKCSIKASAPGYSDATLDFKVDTRASSPKTQAIYLTKTGTTSPAKTSSTNKKRTYRASVKVDNPTYVIDRDCYDWKLISLDDNQVYLPSKYKTMDVPAGKYRLELFGPRLKPVSMTVEVAPGKASFTIPVEPKYAAETYNVSFNLPAFDQMVEYKKVRDFLDSKKQIKQVFTIKREGVIEVRLNAQGKGDIGVSLIEQGKQDGGLGIKNTCYRPGKENRSEVGSYVIRSINNVINNNVVVRASIYESHIKRSRKSDYDAEDRVVFPGGSFSAEIIFHPFEPKNK